jgi:hypothetical protein
MTKSQNKQRKTLVDQQQQGPTTTLASAYAIAEDEDLDAEDTLIDNETSVQMSVHWTRCLLNEVRSLPSMLAVVCIFVCVYVEIEHL